MTASDEWVVNLKAKWTGRYVILLLDCLLVFGIAFVQDAPSALQSQLQEKQENCTLEEPTPNRSCCSECFELGPDKYNQLYAIHSWTNAILIFPAGIFIDRIGNRISGLIATSLAVIGSCLFAASVAPGVRDTEAMFILMMAGRLFTGAATGTSRIVQERVLAVWFLDKISMAFGIVLSSVRLAYVLNFLVTSHISVTYGISAALWLGVAFCVLSLLSAIGFSFLDKYGNKKLELTEVKAASSVKALLDIRLFPSTFWLVCLMLATYYSFLYGYISNGSKMSEDTFGYDKTTASIINGVLYDASLFVCPVWGQINARFGKLAVFALVAGLLSIPCLPLILYTGLTPILWNVILGILNAMAVTSLWPAVALVLPVNNVGTGNGIATLLLYSFGGLNSLIIGKLLNHFKSISKEDDQWLYVFILLMVYLVIMSVCGIFLNIVDARKSYVLNRRRMAKTKSDVNDKSDIHDINKMSENLEQNNILEHPTVGSQCEDQSINYKSECQDISNVSENTDVHVGSMQEDQDINNKSTAQDKSKVPNDLNMNNTSEVGNLKFLEGMDESCKNLADEQQKKTCDTEAGALASEENV